MILRVRYILLTNGWVIEVGGKWLGADGKPATIKAKNPETGEDTTYLLPAKVGPIFFVKDESQGEPDPDEPDMQIASGEHAFYEVWAAPENQKAAELLGGELLAGPCTRRLRIPEQHVLMDEEIWPFAAADKLIRQRSEELSEEYENLAGKEGVPKDAQEDPKKQPAAEATAAS